MPHTSGVASRAVALICLLALAACVGGAAAAPAPPRPHVLRPPLLLEQQFRKAGLRCTFRPFSESLGRRPTIVATCLLGGAS